MRLSTLTATSTSVARRSSVCARNRPPSTCFHLAMAASALARFVYPDAVCQAPSTWGVAWRGRLGRVGGRHDIYHQGTLRRLPLSGRGHQPRGLALLSLS